MHLFIPYFDACRTHTALRAAARIARPGDQVTIMAPVIVPGHLPVNVGAGAIWKQSCAAERQLFHARDEAEHLLPPTVRLDCRRVHARDRAAAIRAGALHYRADLILLDVPQGIRGALSLRFGLVAAVIRQAPCGVRLIGKMTVPESLSPPDRPHTVAPFPTLQIIAANPLLADRTTHRGGSPS